MICSNCGAANEVGRKFCDECGTRLATACPNCGAENRPGARFCGECGTVLASSAGGAGAGAAAAGSPGGPGPTNTGAGIGPAGAGSFLADPGTAAGGSATVMAQAPPSAERRLVSILFADLVGFTTLSEGRDPEETRELLGRYFEAAREIVDRYGGTIEKFIGDAVMAVWGTPTAHEDDAERAVRAGLDVVDAVRRLGPGLQARAGVLTGEAAVTLNAQGQGMVAGDLVNTASRLQSVAAPGTVLVGESTERASSKAIAFEPAGDQVLKGKAAPVPAFRALRVVAERGGRNRADTLEAPFVGRDDELRLLRELLHATGRDRRARLVSVVGQAGIGKSRLAWEFLKYVDGLVETIYWHSGRSPAYGEGVTFWALGEMVRSRAHLAETDNEETTRAKLAETVAEHVLDESERPWIESALLALLGVQPATVGREELFAAWRTFFERIAARSTVVLVFEDLQWADDGLLDFIDHVLDWSKGQPILLVTLARPDLLDRRTDWGGGRRNFVGLSLEPLPEAAMRELLAGLVPGLPAKAADAIVARADGVPLYAVETVRMLVAEGKLVEESGVYHPVADLSALAVPETLQALIAARLDALDPHERSLLQDAAVLGQSFTPAGVSAVAGLPTDEIEPRLRALVRRELFVLDADPRSPERGQYSFVQALIREVAYGTLARRDRKARHLAAARFFEALGEDELAGALAAHYLAAYHLASEGPEADALAAQARIALRGAGERAIGLGSPGQAVRFFEQALEVTTDPVEQAEVLERAGEAASNAGLHERADALLGRAVDIRRTAGDRLKTAVALALQAKAQLNVYRIEPAKALLAPAWEDLGASSTEPEIVAVGAQLARASFLDEDYGEAVRVCDRVLAAAEIQSLLPIVADTLITKGTSIGYMGRPIEGRALIDAGKDLAESQGLTFTALRAYINLGTIQSAHSPSDAIATSRAGIELARRFGFTSHAIILLANAGEFAISTGDWDWAREAAIETLAGPLEMGDRWPLLGSLALIEAFRGDRPDAILEFEAGLEGSAESAPVVALEMVRGSRAMAEGRLAEARQHFRSQAIASSVNVLFALPLAAHVAFWLGDRASAADDLRVLVESSLRGTVVDLERERIRAGIAALDGDSRDAIAIYRDVIREWRALRLPWHEALTALDMAVLLDPADPDVSAAARTARGTFERLGARPFLERLDAALEGAAVSGVPARDREGVARDREGVARDREGVARDREGVARDREGVARDREGPAGDRERTAEAATES